MARYAVEMRRTASATLAVGALIGAATTRFKLYDLTIGSEASAGDGSFLWQVDRWTTAAGTPGSSPAPFPLDFNDGAARVTAGQAYTVNPTVTANSHLLSIALNQRATFRWVAAPGGELVSQAVATTGLMLLTPTAALVAVTASCHFEE